MDAFKEETLYPHVHGLYAAGAYDDFLAELRRERGQGFVQYADDDFARLRRVHDAWKAGLPAVVERRRAIRQKMREEREEREERAARDGGKGGEGGGGGGGGRRGGKRGRRDRLLPGGLLVQICKEYQLLPCPATHQAMAALRAKADQGLLPPGEAHSFYLDALKSEPEAETLAQTAKVAGLDV